MVDSANVWDIKTNNSFMFCNTRKVNNDIVDYKWKTLSLEPI